MLFISWLEVKIILNGIIGKEFSFKNFCWSFLLFDKLILLKLCLFIMEVKSFVYFFLFSMNVFVYLIFVNLIFFFV